MPVDDIFREVLTSATIVPEKKDFISLRAIVGLVAGVSIGTGLAFFGVSDGVLVSSILGGALGYFLGVILVELLFWIALAVGLSIAVGIVSFVIGLG